MLGLVLVVVAITFTAVRPTIAEPATQPATAPAEAADAHRVTRWLSELASSDAAVRDAARDRLMRLDRGDLAILQQVVRNIGPLAPAQAAAIRPIVEEVFLAGEPYRKEAGQGFLGIIMDQSGFGPRDLQQPNENAQASGVIVADRFPGFCASRSLRDGDVILGTTEPGQAFNGPDDLKQAIGMLQPGSIVRLQVLRHGQVIEVPLKLDCKPADLDPLAPGTADSFRREREERFEQYWRETFAPLLRETVG